MSHTPDARAAAQEAGLRHTSDSEPGLRRVGAGTGFFYRDADGARVTDERTLRRIATLAIPPAWTNVWISTRSNGHLQATGRDARGRKQYRYHPRWREVRDETKFEAVLSFGRALPEIRRRVDADLRRRGLPREKVLAAVVRLLETTLIRVGNEEYARDNQSFGLTTMQRRHADVSGARITFSFRGKSGVPHEVALNDRRLATIVRRTQALPGKELFAYVDDDGQRHSIDSGDVNDYLRDISGEDFTAKDFRTWAGTLLAARALAAFEETDSAAAATSNVVAAVEDVAGHLGNTAAVCRACYVHPALVEAYLDGQTVATIRRGAVDGLMSQVDDLPSEEAAVLALLASRVP